MSTASALLSMIAPAAPATPQGSATADASVFEGLLASMAGAATAGQGEGESDAGLGLEMDLADDLTGLEVGVSIPGLPAAVQPLLQITGAALSALASEAVHAPITVALTTPAAGAEVEAPATALPDVAAETSTPTAATAEADLATKPVATPVDEAAVVETPDVDASPILDVAPLVQPVQPTPVVDVAAETPASITPRPATPVAETVAEAPTETIPQVRPALADKPVAGSTDDFGPQVRPAAKSDPVDDAQVQPLAPTDVTAKATPAEPLVRPVEPVVDDLINEPIPPAMVRHQRPTDASTQVQQTAAPVGDVIAPAQPEPAVAPTPDLTAKANVFAPLTQPPVAADAAVKATPVADSRPLTQPPLPVEIAADTTAKAAVAEPLTTPQEPVSADAAAPVATPDIEGRPVDAPRSAETPNLRALAERASLPVETNAAVDTAAPATPATTAPQTVAPAAAAVAVASAAAPKPAADAVAEVAEIADSTDMDAPVEGSSPEAAPSAQAAHAARETLTPTLSRATIEATAQIAAQILKKLDGRSTRFEMALTPDDLGRVDVKLEIDAEGRLAARLAFDNPAAAADLKGRADELRRQLEQQGFQLADDAFDFTQRDSGSSAFDRGQDSRQNSSRAFAAASRLNTEADIVAQPAGWTAVSLTPVGVDMKV